MSYVRTTPLRPMPNSKRPSLMWSMVATSSAMRSGWFSGSTCTAVPTRRCLVRLAMALATCSEAEMTERVGVKWISPSHTQSAPQASAWSATSKMSRKADAWFWLDPCRISSTKIPKCTPVTTSWPRVRAIVYSRTIPAEPGSKPDTSSATERVMNALVIAALLLVTVPTTALAQTRPAAKPEGEMRWALYVTLAPAWFDPGEVSGSFLTPFWVLYALHDALVKPMPGNLMAPSLAESWTLSADQRIYEFKLREGLKFHNGDPFTAEDVKFSFYRAKGSKILHDKVREVTIVDPYRIRFTLHDPWPDFMTFYGTLVSGAAWVVPKKYVERVGEDGFRKQPIGLGPYKFVSHMP